MPIADAIQPPRAGTLTDGRDDRRKIVDMDQVQVTLRIDGHGLALSQRLDIGDSLRSINARRTQDHMLDARTFEPALGFEGCDGTWPTRSDWGLFIDPKVLAPKRVCKHSGRRKVDPSRRSRTRNFG